jgi:hypothetical protein
MSGSGVDGKVGKILKGGQAAVPAKLADVRYVPGFLRVKTGECPGDAISHTLRGNLLELPCSGGGQSMSCEVCIPKDVCLRCGFQDCCRLDSKMFRGRQYFVCWRYDSGHEAIIMILRKDHQFMLISTTHGPD